MVDNEKKKKVLEAIEQDVDRHGAQSNYSFQKYLQEHKLFSDKDKHRGDEVMIMCPFHGDKNPSLSINYNRRIWNCLGCGRGGHFVDFVYNYDTTVLDEDISWNGELNRMLKADHELQLRVGFSTIFIDSEFNKELPTLEHVSFRYTPKVPENYLELATALKKHKCSLESMQFAILLMQSGLSASQIYKQVINNDDEHVSSVKKYTLEELESEEDE